MAPSSDNTDHHYSSRRGPQEQIQDNFSHSTQHDGIPVTSTQTPSSYSYIHSSQAPRYIPSPSPSHPTTQSHIPSYVPSHDASHIPSMIPPHVPSPGSSHIPPSQNPSHNASHHATPRSGHQIPPMMSGLHHGQPSLHHHGQNSGNGAGVTNGIVSHGMGHSNGIASSNSLASPTGMSPSGGLGASNSMPSHTLGSPSNLNTPTTTMGPSSNMGATTVGAQASIPPNGMGPHGLAPPQGGMPMRPMHHQIPFQSYDRYYGPVMNQGAAMSNMHQPGGHLALLQQPHSVNMGHPYGNPQMAYHTQPQPMHPPPTDRPFKCDQCIQCFSRNHDLKRHKRIHLAIKPFPCGNCPKTFSRKDALKRHRLVKGCKGAQNGDGQDAKSQGDASDKNDKDTTPT